MVIAVSSLGRRQALLPPFPVGWWPRRLTLIHSLRRESVTGASVPISWSKLSQVNSSKALTETSRKWEYTFFEDRRANSFDSNFPICSITLFLILESFITWRAIDDLFLRPTLLASGFNEWVRWNTLVRLCFFTRTYYMNSNGYELAIIKVRNNHLPKQMVSLVHVLGELFYV